MAQGLPYNGWTAAVRHGSRYTAYERARRWGVLPPAAACLCCRASLPQHAIPYHAEEYGPTHEDFWLSCVPMCHRCHAWLHARFAMPKLWRLLVSQAANGEIDETLFPTRLRMAPVHRRPDTGLEELSSAVSAYFAELPMQENSGPPKVATLLVRPQGSADTIRVPDWEVYGERLERATEEERALLLEREVPVGDFLDGRILIERDTAGQLWYDPLYRPAGKRRPYKRRATG